MHLLQRVLLGTLSFATLCLTAADPMAAQQSPAMTPSGAPSTMHLCVEKSCEKLVWRGSYYDGIKDVGSGIVTHYTVSQWSPQGVRIEGKSIAPVSQSATQLPGGFRIPSKTYMEGSFAGSISSEGNSVDNGVVNWKMGKVSGEKVFTLTWDAEPAAPKAADACPEGVDTPRPVALEICDGFCAVTDNHDVAQWTFNGPDGLGFWSSGMKANLRIIDWSNGKVTIRREDRPDSSSSGVTAVYSGTVCGNIVKGTLKVSWPGHSLDKSQGPFKADVPNLDCEAAKADTLVLMDRGKQAIRFRQPHAAFVCFSRAAEIGDMDARAWTGVMYRDGIGTKASPSDAVRLLKQAAVQGSLQAQLALYEAYDEGLEGKPNPEEAKHWADRAWNNPVAVQIRQKREDVRHVQDLAFMSLTTVLSAMSRPDYIILP